MSKLNITATDASEKTIIAALSAIDFHRRHGAGFCDLITYVADGNTFEAFCDVHNQFGSGFPDARLIERALRIMHDGLASRKLHAVEAYSVKTGICIDGAARWMVRREDQRASRRVPLIPQNLWKSRGHYDCGFSCLHARLLN